MRFYNIANTLLARTWSEDLRDSLHNLKGKVLKRPHQGWIRSLKPDFQTIVSSDRRSFYDRYNITHLVKLVRNRLAHYDQQDQEEDEGLQVCICKDIYHSFIFHSINSLSGIMF